MDYEAQDDLDVLEFAKNYKAIGQADDLDVIDFATSNRYIADAPKPLAQAYGIGNALKDIGASVGAGIIGAGESAVGLLDIPTLGRAGKAFESLGVDFPRAKQVLQQDYSQAVQQANQKVGEADGFFPTVQAYAENPSAILAGAGEQIAPLTQGLGIGRVAKLVAPGLSGLGAGAVGAGVQAAGSTAEQVRQQTPDKLLTPGQTALAVGSGALTGAIARGVGKYAGSKGINDIDQLFLGRQAGKGVGLAGRVAGGAASEGVEEAAQSGQEQAAKNLALGRPVTEGVGSAAGQGLVLGGAMGGAGGLAGRPVPQGAAGRGDGADPGDPGRGLRFPEPVEIGVAGQKQEAAGYGGIDGDVAETQGPETDAGLRVQAGSDTQGNALAGKAGQNSPEAKAGLVKSDLGKDAYPTHADRLGNPYFQTDDPSVFRDVDGNEWYDEYGQITPIAGLVSRQDALLREKLNDETKPAETARLLQKPQVLDRELAASAPKDNGGMALLLEEEQAPANQGQGIQAQDEGKVGEIIQAIDAKANEAATSPINDLPQPAPDRRGLKGQGNQDGDEAKNEHQFKGIPIQELPLSNLSLSKDVPQFKGGSNAKGIVEPLSGKYNRTGTAPIQVWERNNGDMEVITGRHRFDLAQRVGEQTIPAQVHRERDGFTATDAAVLDAELNIQDGQGSVKDYVRYFENAGIGREEAERRGLVGRTLGKRAFTIAEQGTPVLIAAHRNGAVTDEQASEIARLAPGDEPVQAAGVKAAQSGKDTAYVGNLIRAINYNRGSSQETADLFGFDESAMKQAEAMASNQQPLNPSNSDPEQTNAKESQASDSPNASTQEFIINDNLKSNTASSAKNEVGKNSVAVAESKNKPTIAQIEGLLPRWAKRMQQDGKLEVVQSHESDAEGLYLDGKIVLVADNIDGGNLNSVLRHEAYHYALENDPKAQAAAQRYRDAMAARYKLASNGVGSAIEKAAYQRVIAAETAEGNRLEEFQAYLVSEYGRAPEGLGATVRKAIQDFTASIRAALMRMGVSFKGVTPADLSALARQGAKSGFSENLTGQVQAVKASATGGDTGQEPRFSKKPPISSPILESAKRKAGLGEKKTLAQAVVGILRKGVTANAQAIKSQWQAYKPLLEQGIFDQFLGIRLAEKEILGDVAHSMSGYIAARMSTGSSSTMAAILEDGSPIWEGGVVAEKPGSKGFIETIRPVQGDLDNFAAWMVGRRALRLAQEGRENNFTQEDIQALLALEQPGYANVAKGIAEINGAVLDFAEQSGLVDPAARALFENGDYIPFYRLKEGGQAGVKGKSGLSHQRSGIVALKGGGSPLSDPLGNLMQNWAHLVDASMKNVALDKTLANLDGSRFVAKIPKATFKPVLIPRPQIRQALLDTGLPENYVDSMPTSVFAGIAKMWSLQAPDDPGVVRVMRGGKPEYFKVEDPMLLTSLVAFERKELTALPKAMRYAKNLLTRAVTADPTFMARNFVRDTLHTYTVSEEKGFKLGVGAFSGAAKAFEGGGAAKSMKFAGASFQGGYGSYNDPGAARASLRAVLTKRGVKDVDGFMGTVLDTPKKWWQMYRSFGDAVENANRVAYAESGKQAGKEAAEYLFEAKDLMDFSMHGSFALVRNMGDMLPFFNARLQGLYRLAKAGKTKEARRLIVRKGLSLALMSVALLAVNSGNERYEELEDWDKDQYWHFFFGDKHFRLPKPFELGFLFGTIPERSARALSGADTLKEYGLRIGHGITDALAFNPVPQLFRPLVEIYANTDMFTGRPIEGMADEGRLPSARYNETTSATMRAIAGIAPEALQASPKRLEHLLHGYLGSLGMYALGASDIAVRAMADLPELPAKRIDQYPIIKAFYQEQPAMHTRYGTEFYEMLREVEQVYRTVRFYSGQGQDDKADALLEANKDKLAKRRLLTRTNDALSGLRGQMDAVVRQNLSPDGKKAEMDRLLAQKNALEKRAYQGAREAFR